MNSASTLEYYMGVGFLNLVIISCVTVLGVLTCRYLVLQHTVSITAIS